MLEDIYIDYGIYLYVPMTQGSSMAVPVTVGCTWNKCLYCELNHTNEFRFLGLSNIKKKLEDLKTFYENRKRPITKVVMVGGNPLCLDTNILIDIIRLIKSYFPDVNNISGFARADDILRKTEEELIILRNLGLNDISVGVESGNDEILAFHKKGLTREDNYLALKRLEKCGISYSTYIMLGLGGKKLSKENALDTASLLSNLDPKVIIVVTLVLFKAAKLIENVKNKEFQRLSILESIREERLLLENLDLRNTLFNATHKTNTLILKGRLPDQKDLLLDKIDKALSNYDYKELENKELSKWKRWSIE